MKLFGCLSKQDADDVVHHLEGEHIVQVLTSSMLAKKTREELVELALEQRRMLEEQRVKNEELRRIATRVGDVYKQVDVDVVEPSRRVTAEHAKLIRDTDKVLEEVLKRQETSEEEQKTSSLAAEIQRLRELNGRTIESIEREESGRLDANAKREQMLKIYATFVREDLTELMTKKNAWYKKVSPPAAAATTTSD